MRSIRATGGGLLAGLVLSVASVSARGGTVIVHYRFFTAIG
jgi:hypothetical protein